MVRSKLKMTNLMCFQFLINETYKNKSKIFKVFFTIFISLLIFSLITILKNTIEEQIKKNSRDLLGGDVEISTKSKVLNSNYIKKLKENFIITEVVEFSSILKTANKKSKTTRIKVVDNFYPLVGEVDIEPINSLQKLKNTSHSILIDKSIKNNLELELGDKITIQNISFEVIGIINSLPDIGGFFLFW